MTEASKSCCHCRWHLCRSALDVPPLRFLPAYDTALEHTPMMDKSGLQVGLRCLVQLLLVLLLTLTNNLQW